MRLAAAALLLAPALHAQTDSVRQVSPITVTVSRAPMPLELVAAAVSVVSAARVMAARPTWGMDELLANVPGVFAANRYNFSLDQRISIRGFGARSSFNIRGVKVLLDGIPQTLPDGSGQLNNVEYGALDRVEVLRGSASALYGNASGGVISLRSAHRLPARVESGLRFTAGTFDRDRLSGERTWAKWLLTQAGRVGGGYYSLSLSRLTYDGERQHSAADFRTGGIRLTMPLGERMTLSSFLNAANDPQADNPGALTAAEMAANRDSAAAVNLTRRAGKDVSQIQAGASMRRAFDDGGDAELALFGTSRELRNPQTFAYISIDRLAFGARGSLTRPVRLLGRAQRLTAGFDLQRQRDDRTNVGNNAGQPDTVRQLDQLETVTEIGPFVQTVVELGARTAFTAGMRYDWVQFSAEDRLVTAANPDDSGDRTMRAASGSLGIARSTGAFTVYGNVGTSFETPTTTELTNRPDTAGGFNGGLNPQRAVNYEIGVRGAWGVGRGSLSIYRAHVRDALISYQVTGSPGRVFFQNAGRSRHQGIELGLELGRTSVQAHKRTDWSIGLAYTFSDFRYTSYTARGQVLDGRRLPGIPPHLLQTAWRAAPAFARGAWLEIQHTQSSGVLVDDTMSTRSDHWWTADVRAGWNGRIGRLRLEPFVALNNVFDRHYVSSVVINAANGRYFEPAPGRNGHAGVSLKYGS